jgi:hypothetical protein
MSCIEGDGDLSWLKHEKATSLSIQTSNAALIKDN